MSVTATELIAENVRAVVARRRLRQVAIGERLGLNQQQVSRRLNGQVPISAAELQQLAQLLDVPVAELYGEAATA